MPPPGISGDVGGGGHFEALDAVMAVLVRQNPLARGMHVHVPSARVLSTAGPLQGMSVTRAAGTCSTNFPSPEHRCESQPADMRPVGLAQVRRARTAPRAGLPIDDAHDAMSPSEVVTPCQSSNPRLHASTRRSLGESVLGAREPPSFGTLSHAQSTSMHHPLHRPPTSTATSITCAYDGSTSHAQSSPYVPRLAGAYSTPNLRESSPRDIRSAHGAHTGPHLGLIRGTQLPRVASSNARLETVLRRPLCLRRLREVVGCEIER